MKFKLCDTDFLPLSVACASGGAEEAGRRSWDELHHVGLPEDVDVQSLFDESGQCWAHQQCALWSEGVCQAEDQSLLYVDRAIHSGSTE
ncbi:histone-lysine N-methyltransferase 2C isoform X1, partial [Tachysurus ichikawai]